MDDDGARLRCIFVTIFIRMRRIPKREASNLDIALSVVHQLNLQLNVSIGTEVGLMNNAVGTGKTGDIAGVSKSGHEEEQTNDEKQVTESGDPAVHTEYHP